MANHDFEDITVKATETKHAHRKELSQQAGRLVSQLAAFKAKYDTVYALSTPAEQAALDTKFTTFKLDAKGALGL